MAQKKIIKKEKRKDDLDPNNDEFMVKSMSILDWAVERRMPLGAVLMLALLIAITSIVVNRVMQTNNAAVSTLLGAGLDVSVAPIKSSEDEVPTKDNDNELWFENETAKATESLKLFKIVTEEESGSSYASMAKLNMAGVYFDNGKYSESIKAYQAFLDSMDASTEWLYSNAIAGLGQALEASGKLDEAQVKYKELSEKSSGSIALMGKYNQARILEQKKDGKDAAITLLKEIIDSVRDNGTTDKFNFLFVEARERLLVLEPNAVVPDLPSGIDFDNMDPEMLQRLIQAQQAATEGTSR